MQEAAAKSADLDALAQIVALRAGFPRDLVASAAVRTKGLAGKGGAAVTAVAADAAAASGRGAAAGGAAGVLAARLSRASVVRRAAETARRDFATRFASGGGWAG